MKKTKEKIIQIMPAVDTWAAFRQDDGTIQWDRVPVIALVQIGEDEFNRELIFMEAYADGLFDSCENSSNFVRFHFGENPALAVPDQNS
jgi:hypothetical protein